MSNYYRAENCKLLDFTAEIESSRTAVATPYATSTELGVPLYKVSELDLKDSDSRQSLQSEWAQVLMHGAGVVVLTGAYSDTSVVDACTEVFEQIIADQHAQGDAMGDHFAAGGAKIAFGTRCKNWVNETLMPLFDILVIPHYKPFAKPGLALITK